MISFAIFHQTNYTESVSSMVLETLKDNCMFQLVVRTEWRRFESADFVGFFVNADSTSAYFYCHRVSTQLQLTNIYYQIHFRLAYVL